MTYIIGRKRKKQRNKELDKEGDTETSRDGQRRTEAAAVLPKSSSFVY